MPYRRFLRDCPSPSNITLTYHGTVSHAPRPHEVLVELVPLVGVVHEVKMRQHEGDPLRADLFDGDHSQDLQEVQQVTDDLKNFGYVFVPFSELSTLFEWTAHSNVTFFGKNSRARGCAGP